MAEKLVANEKVVKMREPLPETLLAKVSREIESSGSNIRRAWQWSRRERGQ